MGERKIYEPEMLRELEEKIKLVGERLSKSYVDKRRGDSEFEVFNKVFLKVFSMKGVMRFGFRGKHSLRFVGPSEILTRMGKVVYQLTLSPALSGVQDVFHVFMLRKYVYDPSHIIDFGLLQLREDYPLRGLQLK